MHVARFGNPYRSGLALLHQATGSPPCVNTVPGHILIKSPPTFELLHLLEKEHLHTP
jgi:hypothetical protein